MVTGEKCQNLLFSNQKISKTFFCKLGKKKQNLSIDCRGKKSKFINQQAKNQEIQSIMEISQNSTDKKLI